MFVFIKIPSTPHAPPPPENGARFSLEHCRSFLFKRTAGFRSYILERDLFLRPLSECLPFNRKPFELENSSHSPLPRSSCFLCSEALPNACRAKLSKCFGGSFILSHRPVSLRAASP